MAAEAGLGRPTNCADVQEAGGLTATYDPSTSAISTAKSPGRVCLKSIVAINLTMSSFCAATIPVWREERTGGVLHAGQESQCFGFDPSSQSAHLAASLEANSLAALRVFTTSKDLIPSSSIASFRSTCLLVDSEWDQVDDHTSSCARSEEEVVGDW